MAVMNREQKTHRLTLTADQGRIILRCERGDLWEDLGPNPTPTDVATAADRHWGSVLRETPTSWFAQGVE